MEYLKETLKSGLTPVYDSDTTDRLKYVYSPRVILVLAFLILTKNHVGEPLQCWVPNQFSDAWEQYTEKFCFVDNTYAHNLSENNLPSITVREKSEIGYYQWVPFILALHAILLYVPRFVWTISQSVNDVRPSVITVELRKKAMKFSNKEKDLTTLGLHDVTDFAFHLNQQDKENYRSWKIGRHLTISIIFTKILSIAILVIQWQFLSWFLSSSDPFFGFTVLSDMLRGHHWQNSHNFPRVTFCDIEIREMGQVHRWSLQCVLMVNMYNEKVFIFLWFWLIVLIAVSVLNLLKWILNTIPYNRTNFVHSVINCSESEETIPKQALNRFVFKVLGLDGVTMLRLIDDNATIYQANDFIKPLWDKETNLKRL